MWLSITPSKETWDQVLGEVPTLQSSDQNDVFTPTPNRIGKQPLPPPLRVRTFTIHCGTNIALWTTEWAASDKLVNDVAPGLKVSIEMQQTTQVSPNYDAQRRLQSTTMTTEMDTTTPITTTTTATKTMQIRATLPGDMFWAPQSQTRLYSYASHAAQETVWNFKGYNNVVLPLVDDEVIPITHHPFTIITSPTIITPSKRAVARNPTNIDIVVVATMLIDVIEMGQTLVATPKGREWYFAVPSPTTTLEQKTMFLPVSDLTKIIIYIDVVDDNSKRYKVEVGWNPENNQSTPFTLPTPLLKPGSQNQPATIHNYYQITVAIPMSGENPFMRVGEFWDAQSGSLSELILYSGDASLPQKVHQTIRHHLPIERWLLDAQRSFGNGVQTKCGNNALWCLPYPNPSGWDFSTKSTTAPSFQLDWVGLVGRNAESLFPTERKLPSQVVTMVTVHINGAYRFNLPTDSATTPIIDIKCISTNNAHCAATNIQFKPDYIVFGILMSVQPVLGGGTQHTPTNHYHPTLINNQTPSPAQITSITFSFPGLTYALADMTDITPPKSKLNLSDHNNDDDDESNTQPSLTTSPNPTSTSPTSKKPTPVHHDINENVHITAYLQLEWISTFNPPAGFSKILSPASLGLTFPYNGEVNQVPTALGMTFSGEGKKAVFWWKWVIVGSLGLLLIPLSYLIFRACKASIDAETEERLTMLDDLREETRRTTTASVMATVGEMVSHLTKTLESYQPPEYGDINGGDGGQVPEYDPDLEESGGGSSRHYYNIVDAAGGQGSINGTTGIAGDKTTHNNDNHLNTSRSTIHMESLFGSMGPGSVAGFKSEGAGNLARSPPDGSVIDVLTPYHHLFPDDDGIKEEDDNGIVPKPNQEGTDDTTPTTTTTTTNTTTTTTTTTTTPK